MDLCKVFANSKDEGYAHITDDERDVLRNEGKSSLSALHGIVVTRGFHSTRLPPSLPSVFMHMISTSQNTYLKGCTFSPSSPSTTLTHTHTHENTQLLKQKDG